MSEFFGSVWWLIVTLGVLITFHEFGHFVVARRCGVKVLRFSIGFGKPLWSRYDRHGTEFAISAIPLGGYVKMLDEREGDVAPADLPMAHNRRPVGQRIAIAAAGPAFNLIFTLVAFWLVLVIGRPDFQPIIGAPDKLAAAAGFKAGDRILEVGGRPVESWTDAADAVAQRLVQSRPVEIAVRSADGSQAVRTLPLDRLTSTEMSKAWPELGLRLQPPPAVAATVTPGMPAAIAGLQAGDRILAVNGTPVADFGALGEAIQKESEKSPTLGFKIQRGEAQLDLTVHAIKQAVEAGQPARWVAGIGAPDREGALLRLNPLDAIPAAFAETWHRAGDMLSLIGHIVTGQASPKNISGIITIGQAANTSAQMGVGWFIEFLAIVSLSLAIMNLLPIPILDGGHLVYYLIELIKGSPVSERTQIAGQYVGMMLIVALMGLAFYNDILRIAS